MFISFDIAKPRQTLEQQWAYLIKRGQNNKLLTLRTFFIVLLIFTGLDFLLIFLTPSNNFITLKVMGIVMNALAWCAFIILYLFFLFNKRRNQWRLQQFLKSITDEQLRYSVHIADEKVTIISNGNTYEFAWVEYNSFGIHQDTLYIFNEVNRMNTLYWNQNEMGGEAFLALRKLLEQKGIKQAF